jgi:hypothetical protein
MASAGIVSADFRAEANLPDYRNGLPKVFQNLGQSVGAGYELDGSDLASNPDEWSGGAVLVDYDPVTHKLSLRGEESDWDFQTLDVWLDNIAFDQGGERISGVTLVSNLLTDPMVAPLLSFSDNSLHIAFNSVPDLFFLTTGLASFQVDTEVASAAVPEPATPALFLLGLAGLALRRTGRKARMQAGAAG